LFIVGAGTGGGFDTSMSGQGSGVVAESKPEVIHRRLINWLIMWTNK